MRVPARRRQMKSVPASFPAPTGGWISNRSLAVGRRSDLPPGAAVLDNWFPTATGVVLRRGCQYRYDLGATVVTMFKYVSGGASRLFAATVDDIFDITTDPEVQMLDTTDGHWSTQQITNAGGTFLIGVNGVDPAWIYDGTSFATTSITFPGGASLSTADLSFVWLYAGRLFFIQKNSMSAWYLDVGAIAGELTELPLGGSFQIGGALMWGQSWSLSSGGAGGLSDQCVFTSTEGEVLAYQGLNPSEASSWTKVGLYRIGRPLGRDAFLRAGGDLLICTSVGLISLAKAAQSDLAALGRVAVSYPIEDAWNDMVRKRGVGNWKCLIWPEGNMVIVAPPPVSAGDQLDSVLLVANANTGAWCRFTGWNVSAIETINGQLHFGGDVENGSRVGGLYIGNVSGIDDQSIYTGVCIPLYEDMGAPAQRKIARNARVVKRSLRDAKEKVTAMFDFSTIAPSPPNPPVINGSSLWEVGLWDQAIWGEGVGEVVTGVWKSLGGSGQDVSVCVQVSSGDISPLDTEIIRIDATLETAGVIS